MDEVPNPSTVDFIDVSQAAPIDPPPLEMREAMAEFLCYDEQSHLYGPILGNPELRKALAKHWSIIYGNNVPMEKIAITSGCNQAFCATISALTIEKDEIILAAPWYFNHKMWLDMMGIKVKVLQSNNELLPSPEKASKLITSRTRAICLVSPNNPAGIEYPDKLLQKFFQLGKTNGINIILDETYKDFHSNPNQPHRLLLQDKWDETLIQLYSFSKSFHLTGYRIGAIITNESRLAEIEKFLDATTICPSQVGQFGALWGLRNLAEWVSGKRTEIFKRRMHFINEFEILKKSGWRLLGIGSYFAYVFHPFKESSHLVCESLAKKYGILALPGSMFNPKEYNEGKKHIRIAFANINCNEIDKLLERLSKFRGELAS